MNGSPVTRRGLLLLAAVLLFDVWWRGHTFAPTLDRELGFAPWPVVRGETEPLDCDEAAYGYIGRRLAEGAVMYRDLTENKPPGGYAIYALAVAIGGANELTIRVLPIPLVLGTIALVWWIALKLGGPGAAAVSALAYALLSTDPYLYGNGAQLEQAINLFATAALALMIAALACASSGRSRWLIAGAGAGLGAACLVKQVAIVHMILFAVTLMIRPAKGTDRFFAGSRLADVTSLGAGFGLVWGCAAAILAWQGALGAAFEDVVRYGGSLATLTPPEPNAPPFLIRWVTGNADPDGRLPPPFGRTDYLIWWGTGSWPFWLASLWAVVRLSIGPTTAGRRLVAAWTLSAWVQVAMPGLFWAHYYLLPLPGMAVSVPVVLADAIRAIRSRRGPWVAFRSGVMALLLLAALATTAYIQVRDYLLVPSEELTIRYKGGRQWVALRAMGRDLARRSIVWPEPRLFVWGWQSPLYFYSGLDSVTPHFFADPLLRAYANGDHPLISPRIDRIMRDLERRPPELISVGEVPFPKLRERLLSSYVPSRLSIRLPDGRGLWILPDRAASFESPRFSEISRVAP